MSDNRPLQPRAAISHGRSEPTASIAALPKLQATAAVRDRTRDPAITEIAEWFGSKLQRDVLARVQEAIWRDADDVSEGSSSLSPATIHSADESSHGFDDWIPNLRA
jgi:hypothetical protein